MSLSALINLSETSGAADTIVRAGGVDVCTHALVDDGDDGDIAAMASLYSGLLSNLTRRECGVDALVGKGMGETASGVARHTLFRLVVRIDTIPNVLWMSNACSTSEGRATLLPRSQVDGAQQSDAQQQPLSWLLPLLSSKDDATRLAAASAMRNCSMDEDCHDALVNHTTAVGACLAILVSPTSQLVAETVKNAPIEVKRILDNPTESCLESLVEIRLIIVESLLLLCKSRVGRAALREKDAYLVLIEWSTQEENEEVRNALTGITERISSVEDDHVEKDGDGSDCV